MYACMYVYICMCMYACMYVFNYVCTASFFMSVCLKHPQTIPIQILSYNTYIGKHMLELYTSANAIYLHAHTYTPTYIYTYICTSIYTYIPHLRTVSHCLRPILTRTHIYTYMHIHIHAYTHTYKYTYMHTYHIFELYPSASALY
jgi:hypothetical protein